jgi:hypothetical protein
MSVYNGFSDFLDRNVSTHSSRAGVPTAKKGYVKGMRNIADQLSVRLATGNRIVTYLNEVKGCGFVDRLMNGEDIVMPRFLWRVFVEQDLQLEYTTRNRLRCWRALQLLIKCKTDGKYTKCAMLDGSKSCAKRNSGGKWNSVKCPGISQGLLQFFVDEVQGLKSRADSRMLIDKARQLRVHLLSIGFQDSDMPLLNDKNGINWFARWRAEHNLVTMATGVQLKVPWKRVLRRCRILLINIFRLRALFAKCHQGRLFYMGMHLKYIRTYMCTCVIVVCTYAPRHLLPSRVTSQPIGSALMGVRRDVLESFIWPA